jgi:hypothetical protein
MCCNTPLSFPSLLLSLLLAAVDADHFPKLSLSETSGKGRLVEEVSLATPRAWVVHNFLNAEQCAAIRDASLDRLEPSLVNIKAKLPWLPDKEAVDLDVKKAMTTPTGYLPWGKDVLHQQLHEFVNATFGWDAGHAEMLFVNRYEPGGFYKAHHDGPQRTVTVLVYLSDHADGGGGTSFPSALPTPLLVQPREGMALVFYNVLPNRDADLSALHAGDPTLTTKWIANLWLHEDPIHRWPLGWLHGLTAAGVYSGFVRKVNPPVLQEGFERLYIIAGFISAMVVIWHLLLWMGADAWFEESGEGENGSNLGPTSRTKKEE